MISAFDNGFLDGILIVNAPLDSPKVVNIKVNYETANIFAQPICRLFFLYAQNRNNRNNNQQFYQCKINLQYSFGTDTFSQFLHQVEMINRIEIRFQVHVHNPFIVIAYPVHFIRRLLVAPFRTKAVGVK